jgi:hypothetical protein
MFDSVSFHDPVDEILARARLQLICERGKAALGEGNNSIGDLVPSLFANGTLSGNRKLFKADADALTANIVFLNAFVTVGCSLCRWTSGVRAFIRTSCRPSERAATCRSAMVDEIPG